MSDIDTDAIRKWYDETVVILQEGLIEALEEARPTIQALPRNRLGGIPIDAMSFDLFPWHKYISISFRHESQASTEESLDIAAWRFCETVTSFECKSLKFAEAASHVSSRYKDANFGDAGLAIAHLSFVAAATALLSDPVIEKLREIGFEDILGLSKETTSYGAGVRMLIVKDWDATFSFNYCELVQANQLTARLLGGEKFY